MKKRGFTLVELLAVIVILALIVVILTPIVMNIIDRASKSAAERSAENYVNAIEISVARAQMNGKLLDGSYDVDADGNLCPSGESCTDDNKVLVQVKGKKPQVGSIVVFDKGKINNDSTTLVIEDYVLEYSNEENTYVAVDQNDDETNKEPDTGDKVEPDVPSTPTTICRAVTSAERTTGNVPSGNYSYGDEYICDVGDGIERVFFVLEDGDNTTLTKGDGSYHTEKANIGTTGPGEVSLIMNQNISTKKPTWCVSGYDNTCNADGAKAYLESQTSNWTVDVNLPTYAQIKAAGGNKTTGLPVWLYDYLSGTTHPVSDVYGYLTSTANKAYSASVWTVYCHGGFSNASVGYGGSSGVRPVITISKSLIN